MKVDDLHNNIINLNLEDFSIQPKEFEVKDISYSKSPSDSKLLVNIKGTLTVSGVFRERVLFDPKEEQNIKANYTTQDISRAVSDYLEKHEDLRKYMIQRIENYIKEEEELKTVYLPELIIYSVLQKPLKNAINRFKKVFTLYAVNIKKDTLFSIDKSDKYLMKSVNLVIEEIIKSIEKGSLHGDVLYEHVDTEAQVVILSRIENYRNLEEDIKHYSRLTIVNNASNFVVKNISVEYPRKYEQGYPTFIETDFSIEINLSVKPLLNPKFSMFIKFDTRSPYIVKFLKYFKTIAIFNAIPGKGREKLSIFYDEDRLYVIFGILLFI